MYFSWIRGGKGAKLMHETCLAISESGRYIFCELDSEQHWKMVLSACYFFLLVLAPIWAKFDPCADLGQNDKFEQDVCDIYKQETQFQDHFELTIEKRKEIPDIMVKQDPSLKPNRTIYHSFDFYHDISAHFGLTHVLFLGSKDKGKPSYIV